MRYTSLVRRFRRALISTFCIGIGVVGSFAYAAPSGPVHLECDSLLHPLGIDDPHPRFSWQLKDETRGARQTAYQVLVASRPALLESGKADMWDSGRVESAQSLGLQYAGKEVAPETRYYWKVLLWDKDAKPYAAGEVSWWETGVLHAEEWRAKWIGYEQDDHRRLREAAAPWIWNAGEDALKQAKVGTHQFRFAVDVLGEVDSAILYVAGKDTPAAWVNGKKVLEPEPLPAWKQMPWGTYSRKDVTREIQKGKNSLAVEVTVYQASGYNLFAGLNAVLLLHLKDGSVVLAKTGPGWKGTSNAPQGWTGASFDDTSWQEAAVVSPVGDPPLGRPWPTGPVKYLRRSFDVSKPVRSARLYATALGAYQFHINGQQVGDQILSPGWTDYRREVAYQVYDVTANLKQGSNAIGAYLAPGWYTTPLQWFRQPYNYGNTPPALKAQLRIEYGDGTVDWIASDDSWKAAGSPILQAEIYDGETYDARLTQPGWDSPGFSDAKWHTAELVHPAPDPPLVAQYFQPIRVEKTLDAKTLTSPRPGVYIFDFGQESSGVVRLQVQGARGTDVRLRFAEILNSDGTLYVDNLRTAKATDHYILSWRR